MGNKQAKEKLIKLYGPECFIEKLKLRKDTEPKRYKSKGQMKRMKQLTYHHIRMKKNGKKPWKPSVLMFAGCRIAPDARSQSLSQKLFIPFRRFCGVFLGKKQVDFCPNYVRQI